MSHLSDFSKSLSERQDSTGKQTHRECVKPKSTVRDPEEPKQTISLIGDQSEAQEGQWTTTEMYPGRGSRKRPHVGCSDWMAELRRRFLKNNKVSTALIESSLLSSSSNQISESFRMPWHRASERGDEVRSGSNQEKGFQGLN